MTYCAVTLSPGHISLSPWEISSQLQYRFPSTLSDIDYPSPDLNRYLLPWYSYATERSLVVRYTIGVNCSVLSFLDHRKPQGLFFHAIPLRLYFTRHSPRLQITHIIESLCSLLILWISPCRFRPYVLAVKERCTTIGLRGYSFLFFLKTIQLRSRVWLCVHYL